MKRFIARTGAWIAAIASALLIVVVITCLPKRERADAGG
jgi:hypothetical protein